VFAAIAAPDGREVVQIEALDLQPGQTVDVQFESVASPWRQGLWLDTDGVLRVGDTAAAQLVLWAETAPPDVRITCEASDGLLRFYNVWDSGRGRRQESLSATSGMAVEVLGDGWRRYSCADIGREPAFDKLVVRVAIR
jgi:hypothetical protein